MCWPTSHPLHIQELRPEVSCVGRMTVLGGPCTRRVVVGKCGRGVGNFYSGGTQCPWIQPSKWLGLRPIASVSLFLSFCPSPFCTLHATPAGLSTLLPGPASLKAGEAGGSCHCTNTCFSAPCTAWKQALETPAFTCQPNQLKPLCSTG